MRTIAFLLIFLSAPILLSTCNEEGLHPCGDYVNPIFKWDVATNTYPWNDPTWSTYLENGNRIFEVRSEEYSNVCPENAVKIFTSASISYSDIREVRVRIRYRYGESGEYGGIQTVFGSFGGYFFEFFFKIDDAYGTKPGKFYLYVRWEIVDAKDVETDFNFFKERFSKTEVNLSYYHY